MKNINKVTLICLIISVFLIGGIFVAQGAGFVSYEDNSKIKVWDNVKIENYGLIISGNVSDVTVNAVGNLEILNKDLYVRGVLGIDCPGYPQNVECSTILGLEGNRFLKVAKIQSLSTLDLESASASINLSGTSIDFNNEVRILNDRNLVVSDVTTTDQVAIAENSVFVNQLNVDEIGAPEIKLPNLYFEEGAIFITERNIDINLVPITTL